MVTPGNVVKTTFVRMLTIGWRWICLAFTALRHPRLWGKPALLLAYESEAQKAAYIGFSSGSTLVGKDQEKALVIIPFRDRWDLTTQCIAGLKRQNLASLKVLVALVDNGSEEKTTLEGLAQYVQKPHLDTQAISFRRLTYDIPFNFSRLNNLAIKDCEEFQPDYVCFLNNDVFLEDPETLVAMTAHLRANPQAASVGCTLLYPDRRIQHLCIAVGVKVVGAHPGKGKSFDPQDPWFTMPRPVGAATAALLTVRYCDLIQAQGFDESLATCYQDVDLALKFQAAGKVNWVLPQTVAIHHETSTRRPIHSWDEVRLMYARWGKMLTKNPYFSARWSRWSEQPALTLGEGDYPWEKFS